ncbi:MAG: SpoVA/SpoVAEb family sporulation membrane protein [Clostridium sp.]|nr:SpoVA/SpoVAEb family sporulation membrane protein [Clostridium sp.]MCM1444257.1 SpoVA/SpoVAEb family sporulation membrane protein [Candidatus Amulumruptor caecigallinarius]
MEKKKYQQIVNKNTPKEKILLNGIISFLIGGLMGVIGHALVGIYSYIFSISTSNASVFMITTLIFIGCLFTCFGFFDKFVNFAKCGLIVPITGFAHAMMSATLEYRKEGMITGIGANMFKLAGSVIVFGVVSAYIFGLIRLLIFGG